MSKLIKLKKWLTIEETAEHISKQLNEPVTVADIYRFALDKHLQLSVQLVNHVMARKGKLRKVENENSEGFHLSKKVFAINGVWDLAMFGDEVLDIEHHYQQEISGLEVIEPSSKGVFLRKGDVVCQLQIDFDDDKEQLGSKAAKRDLDKYLSENKVDPDLKLKLLAEHKKNRKIFLNGRENKPDCYKYYPSGTLDDHENNYTLVVRTDQVTAFIQSLSDTPQKVKPLRSNERNSMLILIGALCKKAKIDPKKKGVAKSLEIMTQTNGARLGEETILKILRQIESAIEARST